MNNLCLYCYKELSSNEVIHKKCCKKFFGQNEIPEIDFTRDNLLDLGKEIIQNNSSVTGVQPKLSLGIKNDSIGVKKLTILGVLGNYILKPQSDSYIALPELEDLTMHLAKISKIETVDHSLIYLKNNELAYITKRIDRVNNKKLAMEDMCQLTEKLTEQKYNGSYEQICKAIYRFSSRPLLDIVNFFELLIFSFLTGNSDMHLKNFSIIRTIDGNYVLSPAYDLVPTKLVIKDDHEDLALTLNGKKSKIKLNDFTSVMAKQGLNDKAISNIFARFEKLIPLWFNFIDLSFISDNLKNEYKELIKSQFNRLYLNS